MQDKAIRRLQRQARKAGRHAQQGSTVVLHTGSVYAGLQRLSKTGARCAGVLLHVPAGYTGTRVQLGRLYVFTDSNVKHVLPADAAYNVDVQQQGRQAYVLQGYTLLDALRVLRSLQQDSSVRKADVVHADSKTPVASYSSAAQVTGSILQACNS